MPQPKPFRYTLTYKNVDTILEHAPEGWRDYGVEWARANKWHGFSRKYTNSLRFVLEARDVIRQAFTDSGIEAVVLFKIERNDPKDWQYYTDYIFELDFSTLKDTELYCEIIAITGGLAKLINANADKEYEIPIGEEYKINVPEGVAFPDNAQYIQLPRAALLTVAYPRLSLVIEDRNLSIRFHDLSGDTLQYKGPIFDKRDDLPTEINIKYRFYVSFHIFDLEVEENPEPENIPCYFRVILKTDGNEWPTTYTTIYEMEATISSTVIYAHTVSIDSTITVVEQAGYSIAFIIVRQSDETIMGSIWWYIRNDPYGEYSEADLVFTFRGHINPFSFYGIPLWRLYEKLIEKVTDGKHQAQSNLLKSSNNQYLFASSGDGIRDIKDENGNRISQIKISLSKFVDSINCILLSGFGDEAVDGVEYAVLERASYFFDTYREIIDIGEVSELEISPQFNLFANRISIGYPDKDYDEDYGRDEFNITLNFGVKMNRTTDELNLVSKMRADSYGIQFTRLNYTPEETGDYKSRSKDSSSDNDPFIVHVKPAAGGRTGYDVNKDIDIIEGSQNPGGVFNAYLSPKRCLLRHSSWLAAIFDKQPGQIEFLSSARQDSNLKSQWTGVEPDAIVEKDNVQIDNLAKRLFAPYSVRFTTIVPRDMPSLVRGGKIRGYISFSYNGMQFKGFPMKISESPADNRQQEWTLLLHPDTPNDFLQEVRKKRIVIR